MRSSRNSFEESGWFLILEDLDRSATIAGRAYPSPWQSHMNIASRGIWNPGWLMLCGLSDLHDMATRMPPIPDVIFRISKQRIAGYTFWKPGGTDTKELRLLPKQIGQKLVGTCLTLPNHWPQEEAVQTYIRQIPLQKWWGKWNDLWEGSFLFSKALKPEAVTDSITGPRWGTITGLGIPRFNCW